MWIVVLNFSLFVLLIGFVFYGLMQWTNLINDPDEEEADTEVTVNAIYHRVPLWIVIAGFGMYSLLADLVEYFGGSIQ